MMKQYDSYKDSGVEWIGKIPSHWEVVPLLYMLRQKICDGPHETPKLIDEGIPFISIDSLNDSEKINFDVVKKYISEDDFKRYSLKAHLEKGDVLFSKAATIGKTAIVGDEKFMVWSPLAILKPNDKYVISKYLYYVVNCKMAIEEAILMGNFNTQVNVGMRDLEKIRITCPPLTEQKTIVVYLDKKCGEIDKAIADAQTASETEGKEVSPDFLGLSGGCRLLNFVCHMVVLFILLKRAMPPLQKTSARKFRKISPIRQIFRARTIPGGPGGGGP